MSPKTAIPSRIKDKYLISLVNCSRLYCRFALVLIDYKWVKSTHINFTNGAGH